MPKYIYSTLSADNRYGDFSDTGSDILQPQKFVLIKGGAGVSPKRGDFSPPPAVLTMVEDEHYEILKRNKGFQDHVARGFIVVRDSRVDPEVALGADMVARDGGAQLVVHDFPEEIRDSITSGT